VNVKGECIEVVLAGDEQANRAAKRAFPHSIRLLFLARITSVSNESSQTGSYLLEARVRREERFGVSRTYVRTSHVASQILDLGPLQRGEEGSLHRRNDVRIPEARAAGRIGFRTSSALFVPHL
jgi:hypothetical protein